MMKLPQNKTIKIRVNEDCLERIEKLIRLYPDYYKTKSDVLRAGVYALERWKKQWMEDLKSGKINFD